MKADDFQDRFDMLVANDFRLVDRSVTLDTQNVPRFNGLFRPDTIDDWFSFGIQTPEQYQDQFDMLTDVNVMEMADGTFLSGLYRQTGDARMVHWGMSSAEYQQWMDFYLSQGWDLEVVQNYADGDRYAAIWSF